MSIVNLFMYEQKIGFENDKSELKYNANFSEGIRTNNSRWQDFINKGINI